MTFVRFLLSFVTTSRVLQSIEFACNKVVLEANRYFLIRFSDQVSSFLAENKGVE
jgi:hypothetical protein